MSYNFYCFYVFNGTFFFQNPKTFLDFDMFFYVFCFVAYVFSHNGTVIVSLFEKTISIIIALVYSDV